MVTRGARACFYGVSTAPSHVVGAQLSPNFWDFLQCARYEKQQPNLHGDQTRHKADILHGQPQMMTHDLFAIANLLVGIAVNFYLLHWHFDFLTLFLMIMSMVFIIV